MNFISKRYIWFSLSLIILGFGLYSGIQKGLNYGIDFTGGTSIIIRYENEIPDLAEFRKTVNLEHANITIIAARDFIIKSHELSKESQHVLFENLKNAFGAHILLEIDTIGPSVGQELRKKSIMIVFFAITGLLLYITVRFEIWYALAAILALIHDGLITLGLAAYLQININTAFIAAILTILGYSINDTIVVFDRIRENTKNKDKTIEDIANRSIHQTLARSINTAITTLFVVGALYFFGGITIKEFSLVLLIGITVGAYSSIFIAAPIYVMFKNMVHKEL